MKNTITEEQKNYNQQLPSDNTSGYKGSTFDKQRLKFKAQINKDKEYYYLGYFDTAEEAGEAYRKKEKELFGNFARIIK